MLKVPFKDGEQVFKSVKSVTMHMTMLHVHFTEACPLMDLMWFMTEKVLIMSNSLNCRSNLRPVD